jgi:hypothetical protein
MLAPISLECGGRSSAARQGREAALPPSLRQSMLNSHNANNSRAPAYLDLLRSVVGRATATDSGLLGSISRGASDP